MVELVGALTSGSWVPSLVTFESTASDFYEVPPSVNRVVATGAGDSCRWFDVGGQLRRRAALRRALVATDPELVVSFLDTTNIAVLGAMKGRRVPVVVVEHTDPRMYHIGWRWSLMRWYRYPSAARVVMVAPETVTWAKRFWPHWKVTNICNWVSPRAQVKPEAQRKVITAMGRLGREKGFDLLVAAFAIIVRRFPDWKLEIIGAGPERGRLAAQVSDAGLGDYVTLLGALKDPFPVLAQSSLFVFSSRFEAFGMALAEAMAMGLPVISFDCPSGPRILIRHGVDGLLVPPENVGALAAAICRLLGDITERKRLASHAIEVTDRYSRERIFDEWRQLFAQVVGGHA